MVLHHAVKRVQWQGRPHCWYILLLTQYIGYHWFPCPSIHFHHQKVILLHQVSSLSFARPCCKLQRNNKVFKTNKKCKILCQNRKFLNEMIDGLFYYLLSMSSSNDRRQEDRKVHLRQTGSNRPLFVAKGVKNFAEVFISFNFALTFRPPPRWADGRKQR